MSRIRLQSKRVPPLVNLGTIRAMAVVAKKIAMARKAIEAIREVEDELLLKRKENMQIFKQKMEWTATTARSAGEQAAEAVTILKGMKGDVEKYLRDLKDAID